MDKKNKRGLGRRAFLKAGSAGAGYALGRSLLSPARILVANTGKVYVAADDGFRGSGATGNYTKIRQGVECLLRTMTGAGSEADAWRALGLTSASKVGIKINCLHDFNSPRWETVKALVLSLETVAPAANISLFDNQLWSNLHVDNVYGASLNELGAIWHGDDTYGNPRITVGGPQVYVSQAMNAADFGISFLMARPHCCYAGNLSGLIKNMMGCCCTRTGTSYELQSAAGQGNSFHSNTSGQGFVDLWKNWLNAKMKLYFGENLLFCYDEREQPTKTGKYLYLSQDPAAIDSYATDLFNSVGGLRTATKLVPNALSAAGLGNANYQKIDVAVPCAPSKYTDADVLNDLKSYRSGSKTATQVKTTIDKYGKEETK